MISSSTASRAVLTSLKKIFNHLFGLPITLKTKRTHFSYHILHVDDKMYLAVSLRLDSDPRDE
jgi:hypothetical protein